MLTVALAAGAGGAQQVETDEPPEYFEEASDAFEFHTVWDFRYIAADYTLAAWLKWERSMDTAWMAPVAPARTAMPLGALFLILQGISEFLKCLYTIKHDEWP